MKTYIIFGMHRSGTSFLAHALKDQGINIGEKLLGEGKGNPDGHFENYEFLTFNECLLEKAGGSWLEPPEERRVVEMGENHKEEIRALIAKNKDELWGFKDPRTSLTIRAIMPYILEADDDPFLYVCFRRPDKVADSLYRRDGMPMERGKGLAIEYNRRIIEFLKEFLEA